MDIAYTDIEMEDPAPLGVFYSAVNSRTKSWMWSVAGLYRNNCVVARLLEPIIGQHVAKVTS